MLVQGSHLFAASVGVVWEMLLDPDVIAKTTPGARAMRRVGPEHYQGKMGIGVGGFTAAELDVSITLADVVAPESYSMLIEGTGRFATLRGRVTLRVAGRDTATALDYAAEFEVGGAVAALGHRLLESVGQMMARQGLEALSRELERRLAVKAREPAPGSPEPGP